MYKKALRTKLRFATVKGNLGVEDLWDLSLTNLDKLAVDLDDQLSKSPRKSFISEVTPEAEQLQLKFNIVKDVIDTKLQEKKDAKDLQAKKAEKNRLLEILARKQEANLESLSEEELKERIAKLG